MPEPAISQLTKPWSRRQRRSCANSSLFATSASSLQRGEGSGRKKTNDFSRDEAGGKERPEKSSWTAREGTGKVTAKASSAAASLLILCGSEHRLTGRFRGGVGKSCVSRCVWEFAHCRHQKAHRQGLWCHNTLQARGTSIPTAVQGLSLYLLWCCVYLEERLLQTAP